MSGNIQKRRNWTKGLTIVLILAVAGAVIGSMGNGKETTTDRAYLRNSAGAVLFDHGEHSSSAECAQCHHELYSAAVVTSCEDCHDEGMSSDDFDHATLKEAHSRDCTKCHEVIHAGVKPNSCRECHPGTQPSDTHTVSCQECHDDDTYEPAMMGHDEYLEVEDHTCLGCHAPQSVSQVYHTNCTYCHLETAPEKFTLEGGDVSCGACHLR